MKELIKLFLTVLPFVILLFIGLSFAIGIRDAFLTIASIVIWVILVVLLAYLGTWWYEFLDKHL